MKKKSTSKTKKTTGAKSKHKGTTGKKTASKHKRSGLGKTSAASKAKMKKTIAHLKNGLKELEKEVSK